MSIKQAIEALESCDPGDYSTGHVIHPSYDEEKVNAALAALRSMPAEPVAYSVTCNGNHVGNVYIEKWQAAERMASMNGHFPYDKRDIVPLYATPHTAPLSDAEILEILRGVDADTKRLPPGFAQFARAIERAVLRGGEK